MAQTSQQITAKKDGETLALEELTPDPQNARRHSPRNIQAIEDALKDVGAARSIVIDEAGVVLAGNATIQAAAKAGLTRVRVVDADGTELVAVRRAGLSPEQRTRLALFDNRAAELADGWNTEALKSFQAQDIDLSAFWTSEELAALFAADADPNFAPVGIDEQGRLDQKATATCPECGHVFVPSTTKVAK